MVRPSLRPVRAASSALFRLPFDFLRRAIFLGLCTNEGTKKLDMASPNNRESPKSFGERLRLLREQAGLRSPEALALAAGVAKQTVYNWESRLTPPPPSGVQKIAKALGLTTHELLTGVQGMVLGDAQPPSSLRALPTADELECTCREKLDVAIRATRGIPERLAYLCEQLSGALTVPAHWRTEDKAAEAAKKLIESLGADPDIGKSGSRKIGS